MASAFSEQRYETHLGRRAPNMPLKTLFSVSFGRQIEKRGFSGHFLGSEGVETRFFGSWTPKLAEIREIPGNLAIFRNFTGIWPFLGLRGAPGTGISGILGNPEKPNLTEVPEIESSYLPFQFQPPNSGGGKYAPPN